MSLSRVTRAALSYRARPSVAPISAFPSSCRPLLLVHSPPHGPIFSSSSSTFTSLSSSSTMFSPSLASSSTLLTTPRSASRSFTTLSSSSLLAFSVSSCAASVPRPLGLRAHSPTWMMNSSLLIPASEQAIRQYSARLNTGVCFVPEQEAWVVEWMGKFTKVLKPGLNLLVPLLHTVRYVHSLKVCTLHMPNQEAITRDNVTIVLDGVLYWQVRDPQQASYSIEDPEDGVMQLAQGIMRSEVGRMLLENTFQERATLNESIVDGINSVARGWGVECLRYEIQNIHPPDSIREAMEVQVVTERHKRQSIIKSEGLRQADLNRAEGRQGATVMQASAKKAEIRQLAEGEAEAIRLKAAATADGLRQIARALSKSGKYGRDALTLQIAQEYVQSFGNIAKKGNTMLLPADASSPANMIAQALGIYKQLEQQTGNEVPKEVSHEDELWDQNEEERFEDENVDADDEELLEEEDEEEKEGKTNAQGSASSTSRGSSRMK